MLCFPGKHTLPQPTSQPHCSLVIVDIIFITNYSISLLSLCSIFFIIVGVLSIVIMQYSFFLHHLFLSTLMYFNFLSTFHIYYHSFPIFIIHYFQNYHQLRILSPFSHHQVPFIISSLSFIHHYTNFPLLSPSVVAEAPGSTLMVVSVVGGGEARLSPVPRLALACPDSFNAVVSPSGRLLATWYLQRGLETPRGTVSFRYGW